MVLKKISKAAEDTILIGAKALHSLKAISKKLFLEAEAFARRNVIDLSSFEHETHCCPHCLKAHLLKKAEELDDGRAIHEVIVRMGELETGHNGYYLDGEKVVKI